VPPTSALAEDLRTTTRWPALDGIRGLAVLAVVAYHAYRMIVLGSGSPSTRDLDPVLWPLSTARLALDAFFVLSGFLIVASWTSERRRHDHLGRAAWAYARKRAARILPAYWLSLAILIPLVAPHLLRSPGKLGLLVTVQQYVLPSLPSEVNVVYWSLTTEVHFYVLAPLVALLLRRFGGWRVVAGAVAVAVAWRVFLPAGLAPSFTFGRIDSFVVGAAAGELVRAHDRGHTSRLVAWLRGRGMGVVLVAAFAGLGAFEGAVLDGVGHGAASKLLHTMVALVLGALLVRLLTPRPEAATRSAASALLEHPALRLAGLVSYGVYLCHYPLLHHGLAAAGIEAGDGTSVWRAVPAVLAIALAAFLCGAASYVLVERRFLQPKRPVASPPVIDLRDRELVSA
jgi:peptidoglycan/LPS O-acetylase OafA/YrhL